MNKSSKESLDKAKEEVIQALEKVKQIINVSNDKSRQIKILLEKTKKHL